MVGVDGLTGKYIEEPDHIIQAIGRILTTPIISRVHRREFGVPFIGENASPLPDFDADQIKTASESAIATYEPRIKDVVVTPVFAGGLLSSIEVAYTEIKSGNKNKTSVSYLRPS